MPVYEKRNVDAITGSGVVVDCEACEIDCPILSAGFEVGTGYASRAGFEPVGRGLRMTGHWKDGARTLHGMHIHNFPNFSLIGITQSGFTASSMHMIDQEAKQIACTVHECPVEGIEVLEVSEADWTQIILDRWGKTIEFAENCPPGYYNGESNVSPTARQDGFYFGDDPH